MTSQRIPGFQAIDIEADGVSIHAAIGGAGPPLLLLHGYPQTHFMWRHVATAAAKHFTVVMADLTGYGASDKPPGGEGGARYAKRSMAADQVAAMATLGFDRFAVAGHDRGGRVAHRMALDHPEVVTRLAVLDIIPTRVAFARTDAEFARAYYHWFFLAQPRGFPERLIGADPAYFLAHTLAAWSGASFTFDGESLGVYTDAFRDPATIAASCDDYRAAAGIDLVHDAADTGPATQPLLVMWGTQGAMHRLFDVPGTWADLSVDCTACPVDSGHFLPEEAPAATAEALLAFLTADWRQRAGT